jgi:signal transduction histidine kinase
MEKLTYGNDSRIDFIFQNIQKRRSATEIGQGTLLKRPTIRFRTYTGIAGIIRRRMVISISVALFYGSISILLGFLLYARQLVNLAEAITFIGLLFIIGLILNGWLILRMMRNPLSNIEHVEDTLVEMVESGTYKIPTTQVTDIRSTPFIQAYYAMLEHVDDIETNNLEFLAKISHEIRSPLASILGYSELLTDPKLRYDDQFIDTCYNIIRKEGNQVCRLVEDAVLASGISSGHYNFEYSPIQLDQFLKLVVDETAKRTDRQIEFLNHAGEVTIIADAIGLREVFNNLFDNGVKFSAAEKPMEVELRMAKNPEWVEIAITDLGIGIEEKDQPILFRRFSRIHNERTSDIPGNGLGLYIANNIVMNHQGEIKVESIPGSGSTFTVSLPVENSSH